jgi:Na+/H+ antiporter NhaD/arsenite permease-like protein
MNTAVLVIFVIVYLGMILGGLPFLQLDRTGVALLGAIALVGVGAVSIEAAVQALHLPTLILLFAFMVVSAQLRLGGFYAWVTLKLGLLPLGPPLLLGALVALVGALSAVFSNDVVCLAVAPVLIDACRRRDLNPLPFLLGLACAANVGSAATLIGNPQNMLIGATLGLSFGGYAAQVLAPVLLGLLATWAIIAWQARGHWAAMVPAREETRGRRTPPRPPSTAGRPSRACWWPGPCWGSFSSPPGPARRRRWWGPGFCSPAVNCIHATCSGWWTGNYWCSSWASSWSTMPSRTADWWRRR